MDPFKTEESGDPMLDVKLELVIVNDPVETLNTAPPIPVLLLNVEADTEQVESPSTMMLESQFEQRLFYKVTPVN